MALGFNGHDYRIKNSQADDNFVASVTMLKCLATARDYLQFRACLLFAVPQRCNDDQ
jgi:hypothetical protein